MLIWFLKKSVDRSLFDPACDTFDSHKCTLTCDMSFRLALSPSSGTAGFASFDHESGRPFLDHYRTAHAHKLYTLSRSGVALSMNRYKNNKNHAWLSCLSPAESLHTSASDLGITISLNRQLNLAPTGQMIQCKINCMMLFTGAYVSLLTHGSRGGGALAGCEPEPLWFIGFRCGLADGQAHVNNMCCFVYAFRIVFRKSCYI